MRMYDVLERAQGGIGGWKVLQQQKKDLPIGRNELMK